MYNSTNERIPTSNLEDFCSFYSEGIVPISFLHPISLFTNSNIVIKVEENNEIYLLEMVYTTFIVNVDDIYAPYSVIFWS